MLLEITRFAVPEKELDPNSIVVNCGKSILSKSRKVKPSKTKEITEGKLLLLVENVVREGRSLV